MTSIDHGVRKSWDRIDAWLGDHLHRAPVRAAADGGRLGAFEADIGAALPTEVHDWWTLDRVSADYWIPGSFAPVGLEDALETREIWLLVAEQEGASSAANGEPEPRFLPSFLPIAMSPGGDGLIVDLRFGDSYGAVFLWDHETWVLGVPLWGSVASMLQDIAAALESGTPALLRHAASGGTEKACAARVDDAGDLVWEVADPGIPRTSPR
ncbi:SMI1/KNR4 family protein [Streptomyces sp. JH34]|uniref:SMI1/KNR4 family protein n=1 Tax=Streptomyces sp. JH34 TaxID=2793633 RepID=UPI0023F80191|nr:SMI1/KNR4 family protein [Streptomyces sp. JH34]MDF6019716.1 SMI1/KNR4 family protein [Streptomyces sp. JH34]